MSSTENSAAGTGAIATSFKDMMEQHKQMMGEIGKAQIELMQASLAKQRDAVSAAGGKMVEKVEGQTADFLAMLGQFTNDLG